MHSIRFWYTLVPEVRGFRSDIDIQLRPFLDLDASIQSQVICLKNNKILWTCGDFEWFWSFLFRWFLIFSSVFIFFVHRFLVKTTVGGSEIPRPTTWDGEINWWIPQAMPAAPPESPTTTLEASTSFFHRSGYVVDKLGDLHKTHVKPEGWCRNISKMKRNILIYRISQGRNPTESIKNPTWINKNNSASIFSTSIIPYLSLSNHCLPLAPLAWIPKCWCWRELQEDFSASRLPLPRPNKFFKMLGPKT